MGVRHKKNDYRKIYEEHYGKIPKGHHIHHIDFNPLNNSIENLIALTPEDHAKIHIDAGHSWCVDGKWIQNASDAGKKGGRAFYEGLTSEERKNWHSSGGRSSVNTGKYNMSELGKKNIREARMKTKRQPCPYGCESKRGNTLFDPGNYKLHMKKVHGEDAHRTKVDN